MGLNLIRRRYLWV